MDLKGVTESVRQYKDKSEKGMDRRRALRHTTTWL